LKAKIKEEGKTQNKLEKEELTICSTNSEQQMLKSQFLPHSKHLVKITNINCLILHREMTAVLARII
jgi:hypothetical protein